MRTLAACLTTGTKAECKIFSACQNANNTRSTRNMSTSPQLLCGSKQTEVSFVDTIPMSKQLQHTCPEVDMFLLCCRMAFRDQHCP